MRSSRRRISAGSACWRRFDATLYDQFDVGHSDKPAAGDFDRYTVEHDRDELEAAPQAIDPNGSFTV